MPSVEIGLGVEGPQRDEGPDVAKAIALDRKLLVVQAKLRHQTFDLIGEGLVGPTARESLEELVDLSGDFLGRD